MSQWDNYPLYGSYDVVVIGGGTAGFAAGASAARNGLKTLIVEELAFLGGTATGGDVGVFFGFQKDETEEGLKGIVKDMFTKLKSKNGTPGLTTIYCLGLKDMDVPAAEYNDDLLKVVMDEIVEESGAQVLFHTKYIGVEKEGSKIKYILIHNTKGIQRVEAKVFVDASFHASLAADAGVPFEVGNENGELQPGTLMYKTGNVDFEQYRQFPIEERQALAREGLATGELPVNFLLARQLQNGNVYHNQCRVMADPLEPENWSAAETAARKQIYVIANWWKNHVPGFENSFMSSYSPFTGLRDSRRIIGKFVITAEELMKGVRYEDTIAESSYPIDVHHADGRQDNTLIRPAEGTFYIPYRSLVTNEIDNLAVIGRCFSADYVAHAALRVTICCMRMGEAVGYAARESIDSGIAMNALDGKLIHDKVF